MLNNDVYTRIHQEQASGYEIREVTKEIDQEYFQLYDFDFTGFIRYNYRLRTIGGRYTPSTDLIEINPKMKRFGRDQVIGIVKHELCHYYIYHTLPNARPHGKEFKSLLRYVGGSRYAPHIPRKHVYRYFYRCRKCGNVFPRQRRIDTYRYVCGKCEGHLDLINHATKVEYR